VTVEPDRAGRGVVGDQRVEPGQQLRVGEGLLDPHVGLRFEPRHDRERRLLLAPDGAHGTVGVGPEELAVERDHLPVEPVQRPQPEVAVLGQLGEAEVAVEGAVEQGADRRGLEEHMRLPFGVQIRPAHRLDVQRSDPAFVQHRRSLPAGWTEVRADFFRGRQWLPRNVSC